MVEHLTDILGSTYQQSAGVFVKLDESIKSVESIYSIQLELEGGGKLGADSEPETPGSTDDGEVSESTDDDETSESIPFYISLLMNLIPSMDQAYNQILQGQRTSRSPLLLQNSSPSTVIKTQSSEYLKSNIDTASIDEKRLNFSGNIHTSASRDRYDKNWVKDLRVRFERMLDERPISQKLTYKSIRTVPTSMALARKPHPEDATSSFGKTGMSTLDLGLANWQPYN